MFMVNKDYHISREYGSSSHMQVIESRSSQKCLFPKCKLRSPI